MPRKLFISHSSRTDANLRLLGDLCAQLEQPGQNYALVYDRKGDIKAGDDWYNRIDRWMAECHAAVILFSRAAIYESDWVRKEAAILSWRKELQKHFVLIPVLLDGLKPEVLETDLFGILRIDARQCVTGSNDPLALAKSIREALDKQQNLARCCSLEDDELSYEPLEGVVARLLTKAADADDLEDTVDALGLPRPSWPPDLKKQNALAVARHLFEKTDQSLSRFRGLLNRLPETPEKRRVQDLFRYLRALWVDPLAARSIPASRTAGSVVVLHGGRIGEFSAARYYERAWPLVKSPILVEVTCSREPEIHADIETYFTSGRELSKQARLTRVNDQTEPVVVLLPAVCLEQRDGGLLERLHRRYPKAMFVIGAESVTEWLPPHVEPLLPQLDRETETAAMNDFDNTKRYLDNMYQGD